MKLGKKVLLLALAVSLTSPLAKEEEETFLRPAYASEQGQAQTKEDSYYILEFLKDQFMDISNNPSYGQEIYSENLKKSQQALNKGNEESLKSLSSYKEALKEDKKVLEERSKTANDENLKSDLDFVINKLDLIIGAIDDIKLDGQSLSIENIGSYKEYVGRKNQKKDELSSLLIEAKGLIKDEDLENPESDQKALLVNKINLGQESLENQTTTLTDMDRQVDLLSSEIQNTSKISESQGQADQKLGGQDGQASANKNKEKNTNQSKEGQDGKIDGLKVKRDALGSKIEDLREKLDENEENLSEKFFTDFNKKLDGIENSVKKDQDLSEEDLDFYLSDLDKMEDDLEEEISNKIDEDDKADKKLDLSAIKTKIKDAKDFKEKEAYFRASVGKRDAYTKAIKDAEKFVADLEKDPSIYKEEKEKNLIKNIYNSQIDLDGNSYEAELSDIKERYNKEKDLLSSNDRRDFTDKLKVLSNKDNKSNTIDDLKSFSKQLDAKIKQAKENKKNSPGKPVKVSRKEEKKKVAVPRSDRKKAKSIVRTGIDSIKIFAVIAVVALALLFVTRKNDENKGEKDQ